MRPPRLVDQVEHRVGAPVLAAIPFTLTEDGGGSTCPMRCVLALTGEDLYLLDCRSTLLSSRVVGVRWRVPRVGLMATWQRGLFRLKAEMWTAWTRDYNHMFIGGWTRPTSEAERLFGLLTTGEFEDAVR